MDASRLGRLYKGEEYDISINIPNSATVDTFTLYFFTDKDTRFNVPSEQVQIEPGKLNINITSTDFDILNDGVLYYDLTYRTEGVDKVIATNTLHYLMTPCGYDAHSAEDYYNDGFSSGYTEGYASGYTDGIETCEDCEEYYSDGYTSGHTDGMADQKALLVSTAFTVNGTYTRENGWNEVEVNIAQTGHTDQELEQMYDKGFGDGVNDQISKLATTAFTTNGMYTRSDGWKGVEVNVPTPKYIGQEKSYNISQNGTTAITVDNGYDGITGGTIKVSVKPEPFVGENKNYNLTSNGTTNITVDNGYDGITGGVITVNVAQTGHTDQEITNAFNSGFTGGHTSGMTDQKNLMTSLLVNVNGTYTRENGWNEVVVDIQPVVEDCLVFEAKQANSTIGLSYPISGYDNTLVLYISTDGKQTFQSWTGSQITLANVGDKVYIYGNNQYINYDDDSEACVKFVMSGQIEGSGSVDSLLQRGGVNSLTPWTYNCLFRECSALVKAPELPNMNLAYGCYRYMFYGCNGLTHGPELPAMTLCEAAYFCMFASCRNLIVAPVLPATTLAHACYWQMFNSCVSLEIAPQLNATVMAEACYAAMFSNCTSLKQGPTLPATTLAKQCYASMFQWCSSLTSAPALPATTLAQQCYEYMFAVCPQLIHAPVLPATTLVSSCYNYMFSNCTRLLSVDVYATTWDTTCAVEWLDHVQITGTFAKPHDTVVPTGIDGIPSGWTAIDNPTVAS